MEFDLTSPSVKRCIEELGEDTTLEWLQDAEKTDSTPICCLHCPYTDCPFNNTYNSVWLMRCSRYLDYKHSGQIQKKELSVEERIARLERLFILASPFITVYNPDDAKEFKKIINSMGGDL